MIGTTVEMDRKYVENGRRKNCQSDLGNENEKKSEDGLEKVWNNYFANIAC